MALLFLAVSLQKCQTISVFYFIFFFNSGSWIEAKYKFSKFLSLMAMFDLTPQSQSTAALSALALLFLELRVFFITDKVTSDCSCCCVFI